MSKSIWTGWEKPKRKAFFSGIPSLKGDVTLEHPKFNEVSLDTDSLRSYWSKRFIFSNIANEVSVKRILVR